MNRIPFSVWKMIGKAMMNLNVSVITHGRCQLSMNCTKAVKSIGSRANPTPPIRSAEHDDRDYGEDKSGLSGTYFLPSRNQ